MRQGGSKKDDGEECLCTAGTDGMSCVSAGSLVNLAKYPASTVQILGAEKALFR